MAQWRDFLGRFRPASAPGAAAPRGVPTDRAAAAAAELEPLFALLDEINAETDRIRGDVGREIAQLHTDSRVEAERITRRAAEDTVAMTAAAAAAMRASAGSAESELDSSHRVGLAALRTRIAARMPDYLDRVVTQAETVLTTGSQA